MFLFLSPDEPIIERSKKKTINVINVKVSSLNIGVEKVSIQNPTLRVIISLISFVFGMKCRLPFNREKAMRYGRLY